MRSIPVKFDEVNLRNGETVKSARIASTRKSGKRYWENVHISIFTALHGMQTRYSERNSVCLSVGPLVKRVHCDKKGKDLSRFLPRCMECRCGLAMRIMSVCPSVRLSVKRVHCDKTEESYV